MTKKLKGRETNLNGNHSLSQDLSKRRDTFNEACSSFAHCPVAHITL